MQNLSKSQLEYLNAGLREGNPDIASLKRNDTPSEEALEEFNRFTNYFSANTNRSVEDEDLYSSVSRRNFLRMLYYADDRDRNCLILQCCFGLTKPLEEGGRIVLINKGNFQELAGRSDQELYFGDSVYRNQYREVEYFLNLNPNWKISAGEAHQLSQNFNSLYAGRDAEHNPYTQGYLLPVRPFQNLLLDRIPPFDSGEDFTFRWGLSEPTEAGLGNFTLVIGKDDCTTGAVIEFRPTGPGFLDNDCPPHTGCAGGDS
jgi:hypothetical protein